MLARKALQRRPPLVVLETLLRAIEMIGPKRMTHLHVEYLEASISLREYEHARRLTQYPIEDFDGFVSFRQVLAYFYYASAAEIAYGEYRKALAFLKHVSKC